MRNEMTRREILRAGLAATSLLALGVPEWAIPALAQGETLVPIPGTKHVAYAEENAGAADLSVPESDLKRAGEIISPRTVSGDRYAKAQMISLDPEDA